MCGLVFLASPVQAQEAEQFKIVNHTTIRADKSASKLDVSHRVQVTNRGSQPLTSLDLALPVSKTDNIDAAYAGGTKIPFSPTDQRSRVANQEYQHTSLALDFPKAVKGAGKTWSFTVKYSTPQRIHSTGDNVTLTVPLLDGGVADGWSATVTAPNAFGDINYRPPAARVSHRKGRQQFVFKKKHIKRNVLGVSFAGSQTYTLDLTTQLRNTSPVLNTYAVNLPFEMHNQSVFIKDITPAPVEVHVDSGGNVFSRYRLWPMGRKQVSVTAAVRVKQVRYDPSGAQSVSNPPEKLQPYVTSGAYWPLEGTVTEKAQEITGKKKNAWQVARRLHDYVRDEIAFEHSGGERVPADTVLKNQSGNRYNAADTLVALLRSQDIPARLIEGFVYPSSGVVREKRPHAWVEAYIAGVGWVTLDPAWANVFGSFGYSSADRIAVKAIGADDHGFYPLESTVWESETGGKLPKREKAAEQVTASGTRYMVLPGVVYDERKVGSRSGHVIDGVHVSGLFNGSLAPRTELKNGQWNLAGFSPFSLTQTVGDGKPVSASSDYQWWPAGIPALLVIGGGVVQFYRYKRKKYLRERFRG